MGKGAGVKIGIASDFNPAGFAAAERRAAALERTSRKNAASIGGAFIRTGDKLQSLGYKMQTLGSTMTSRVTMPLIGVAAAGVAAFKTVEDAEADLIRRTGATGIQADKLRTTFRNVARNTAADMSTIPPVLALVTSRLGLTGNEAAVVTRKLLALAKISGDDAATASEELTKAMKDWSVAAKSAPSFMDKLAAASQKSGVSVSALATNLYTFGSPMRTLGFGMDQTIALLANFERSGVRTDLVMGSLRIGLGKLATKGAKDLPAAMAKSIKAIKDAKSPADATRRSFELFGKRAGADMAAAIREGRFSVDDLMKVLKNSQGTLDRTGGAANTLGKQWGIAKNRMILAASTIGDVLAPYLMKAASWVQTMADKFEKLDPGMKKFIIVVGGIAAVAGPVLSVFGSLTSGVGALMSMIGGGGSIAGVFGAMSSGMGSVAGAAGAAAGATGGLSGVLGGIGAAIGPAGIALAAVAGAGYILYKNWDKLKGSVAALKAAVAPTIRALSYEVKSQIAKIAPVFKAMSAEVVPTVKAVIKYITIGWKAIQPVVYPILRGLVQFIGGTMRAMGQIIRVVMAVIRGDWKTAWSALKGAGKAAWEGIKGLFSGVWDSMKRIGSNVVDGLKAGLSAAWSGITKWISEKIGGLSDTAKKILGIHSPSQVFMRIGEWTGLGMKVGLLKSSKAVKSAAEAMTARAVDAIKAYQDKVAALKERTTAIMGSWGIGEMATNENVSGEQLLGGMRSQVAALGAFRSNIIKLKSMGLSAAIVGSLLASGPASAGGQAAAFASMNRAQIGEYNSLYARSGKTSSSLATMELGAAKKPTVVIGAGAVKVTVHIAGNASEADVERAVNKAFKKLADEIRRR